MLFGWHGLLGSHSSCDRLGIYKKSHKTKAGDKGLQKKWVEGKNGQPRVFIEL